MDRLIAIDPGVHLCAWALTINRQLADIGIETDKPYWVEDEIRFEGASALVARFVELGRVTAPRIVIVEHPTIYPMEKQKGDPNDIVKLAAIAGVVGAACAASSPVACRLDFVEPRRWKGSVPKRIHNERTRARCPEASAFINRIPKSQRNHVWDAIALALWKTERTV